MPVFSCGRSLYIDWRMVVVQGGNVLHHVKREGELSGRGNSGGNMSEGKCPGEMSYARTEIPGIPVCLR